MKADNSVGFTLLYFIGATIVCLLPIFLCTIFLAGFNDSGASFKTSTEAVAWSLQMMLFPLIIVLPFYLIILGLSVFLKKEVNRIIYLALVGIVFLVIFLFYYMIAIGS
ncbi:hypothetical protein [Oceanobacillus manasiensis]|uniref:hypothetical protein n=1 Tax=Oceanobacillus manasiensis TaxID=586413 RepID=UPI0005A8C43C|nr:hypothetical protein [Oceanobacillus manasiensis]